MRFISNFKTCSLSYCSYCLSFFNLFILTYKFSRIVGIVINVNIKNSNLILGEEYKTLWGKCGISDVFCGCGSNIGPGMISANFLGDPVSDNSQAESEYMKAALEKN